MSSLALPLISLMKLPASAPQPVRQLPRPLLPYSEARCGPVIARAVAKASSAAPATIARDRNCRQVSQIIGCYLRVGAGPARSGRSRGSRRGARSGLPAAADPPGAQGRQREREDEEDAGLGPLERPVPAGGLIGDQ